MTPEEGSSPQHPSTDSPELAARVAELTTRVDQLERTIALLLSDELDFPSAPSATLIPPIPGEARHEGTATPPPPLPSLDIGTARETSLEDRLGSQIFNRIAIVAILIGAALGLKLAMDNHLIGPLGRVLVGLIAGAGLIVWSERFRKREFAAFSYSLKAIGSGVLYLSLWAAFQLYHLLPAEAAFGLMLLVTLWNAWMAWVQSSELLAAYAIAGGFATPLLLSTGGNHQVFLFSYLLTIDIATIGLVRLEEARGRSWARLLPGALSATIIYFIGWYSRFYSADQLGSTSVFIALFFLAFLTVPLRFKLAAAVEDANEQEFVRSQSANALTDVLLPLGNAAFGSLAFYSVLEDSGNHASLPWGALLFAAVYLGVMRLPQAAVAKAVHLSLAVLFLTITIPLKASGRWITIGWLAEGVALLWISARLSEDSETPAETGASIHRMLRRLAAIALTLGFVGLLTVPWWLDRATRTAIFNQRFATELAGILMLGAAAWIASRSSIAEERLSAETKVFPPFPSWLQLAAVSTVALNLVALFAGVREIETFWLGGLSYATSTESGLQTALSISAFLMLYGAGLLAVGFWKHSAFLRWQALILLVIAIAKTFLYDVRNLSQGYRVVSFLGLGVLLLGISFFYVRKASPASKTGDKP